VRINYDPGEVVGVIEEKSIALESKTSKPRGFSSPELRRNVLISSLIIHRKKGKSNRKEEGGEGS